MAKSNKPSSSTSPSKKPAPKKTTVKKVETKKSATTKKEILLPIYKKIKNDLPIVFLYPETIELLKNNSSFKRIIFDYINICNAYETANKITDKETIGFIAAYNSITGEEITCTKISLDDKHEIEDKINSLKVFIMNILKKDWSTITSSFKKETKKMSDENEKINNDESFNTKSSNKAFNAEDFMKQNNVSMEDVANGMIRQQANKLLYKDIIENKVYRYDAEPKILVILKWFMIALSILFFSFFIISTILETTTPDYWYSSKPGKLSVDGGVIDVTIIGAFKNGSIGTGSLSSILLIVLFFAVGCFQTYSSIKNMKNKNAKYSYKATLSIFIIVIFFFNLFMSANSGSNILMLFDDIQSKAGLESKPLNPGWDMYLSSGVELTSPITNTSKGLIHLKGWFGIYTSQLIVVCLILFLSIALVAIRPKEDRVRLDKIIEQYIEDIKSGKISAGDLESTNSFGGISSGSRSPFSPF